METSSISPSPLRLGRVLIFFVIIAVLIGLFVTRGIHARIQEAGSVKQRTLDLSIPVVSVALPRVGGMKDDLALPGNIQPYIDSPVYARASGYLKTWEHDIGAQVKAGQVLAEIDAPELDQAVLQAKAALQQAKDTVDEDVSRREQGKAQLEIARITADRWKELAASGVVSRQDNDQNQATFQAQTANLQALDRAIVTARSAVVSAEANLNRLVEMQNFKLVRAPFDGVITARGTDVGALIAAGSGAELFHIAAISKLRVFVHVPQIYSRASVPGVAATLTVNQFPNRHFSGRVVRTSGAIDPATRTLLTEIEVDNSSQELKPGGFAEVHLTLHGAVRTLVVPISALVFRGEGLQAGVVQPDGKAELVNITTGKDFGTEIEVTSGLSENDQVIVNPPDSLASGMPVRIAGQ